MEKHKVCSFFGHRKINETKQLTDKLFSVVEDLIINHSVKVFLFGSRSEFNSLCLSVVSKLKEKYCEIKRIGYPCSSEVHELEKDRERWEEYSKLYRNCAPVFYVDEVFDHKNKYVSGKASYVERNQALIDDSDYCVFYYDETYSPQKRKSYKDSDSYYQPKSGTRLAYNYANQKKKIIINLK